MPLKSMPTIWIAIAGLVCAIGALLIVPGGVGAASPECPSTWPQGQDPASSPDQGLGHIQFEDFFDDSNDDQWFIIRSSDSNGYATIRAYPAAQGDGGYITDSPDEVCYLIVRRPGDTADAAEPTQIVFPKEQEEPDPCQVRGGPIGPVFRSAPRQSDRQGTDQSSIVAQLERNAAEFEYSIGRRCGSLTVTTIGEPLTFNLALADDSSSAGVLGHLFEGLTEVSWLTNRVEPGLARSWEHSADGLTWTFYLRPDVRWHDGQPFTAHDVAFTFNRIIYNHDINANARAAFNFRVLDAATGEWQEEPMTVTVLDDYTVRFRLPVSSAPFLRSMGTPVYPKHILEQYVDAGTFHTVWDIDTDPAEVIGTGPFTIASYEPGQSVVLRRNPNYWLTDARGNRLPYLESIVYVKVPNLAAELARFRAGQSDIHGVLGQEFAGLAPLQDAENFTVHRRGPGLGLYFLAFNMNPGQNDAGESYVAPERLEWFRNTQFRRAVAHAIDKDAIIDDVYHGHAFPQLSSISPAAGDFHNPNIRRYEYDIVRANAILDELGWTDTDGDGIRDDDAGNPIMFTMVTNEGNTVRERTGAVIHQGLQAVGIGAAYEIRPFSEIVPQITATYDWEAIVIGFTESSDPNDGIILWHSSENFHLWHPNQSQPATTWEAEIDDLYVRAGQELDHDRRVALYHRAQEIVAENLPLIFTVQPERITAVRNVFGNATATLYGLWDIRYLYRTDQ